MEYEIVELDEKKVVGLCGRTSNDSPDMMSIIGGLWGELYSGTYESIQNKVNDKRIGAYTEYDQGMYTSVIGCEVSEFNQVPVNTREYIVPKGKYARFVLKGNLHQIVSEFWKNLESVELERNFKFDFEEYQDFDLEDTTIIMYIGIK